MGSSVDPNARYKKKKDTVSGFAEARAKREEEEAYKAETLKEATKEQEEDRKKKAEAAKGFFDRVGDVAGGVGNFVKDAAVDVKDTAVGAWQGLGDVARGEFARQDLERNTEIVSERNKEWSRRFNNFETDAEADAKWKDPEFVKEAQAFNAETKRIRDGVSQQTKDDLDASQKVDAKKVAFQSAETFLNVATLGVGTPLKAGGKAVVKQGAKAVAKQSTKQLLKQAVKSGGSEAIEQAILMGGKKLVNEAAQEVLEKGAKTAVKQTGKEIVKKATREGAKDAAVGAAYGITQTGKRDDDEGEDDKDLDDYLVNAAFGAGIGFAIPFVGAGAKEGTKKAQVAEKAVREAADEGDLNKIINRTIEEQSDKYGTTPLSRVKTWIGDQIDPLRAFVKIDDEYAAANGIKRTKLNSEDSLEDLARRSAASEREAAGLFEQKLKSGRSASDLVKKYAGDSPEGKEFNNYTNAKFDLEFREKNGGQRRIQEGLNDSELKAFVDDYEVRNPEAVTDLALKKEVNDMAIDYMVKSKVITAEEAAVVKKAYKNAVPLERVFPDDLARPQVTGNNVGSIAKQTVLQKLEGGSDIPLSNSFDTMLNRVYKAVSQGNRAKLAQKLLERQESGMIKGGKIAVTAGNKEARQTLREQAALVTKGARILDKKVKMSNRQIRKIESELNKLNKEGLNIDLKAGGKTPLPDMAPEALAKLKNTKGKTTTSRAFFKSLIEADPKGIKQVRDKIAKREPKLAAKLDEVMNYQTQIDALKGVKTDLKDITAEFIDDPTTGKQLISGIIDGQGYKMEVPPDLAKAVMGLDQQKLPSVLKALAIAKKPFEVTWTGVLNPVFSAISFAFYDTPMSIINSPQGFKTMGPKAVRESLRSFRSSSEFQQMLAKEGARPYGGSGASSFIKPDAKSIASQRSLLSNIKYTSTHPETALSKLDIWGGKLANSTRTRIARAAYDDALKVAKREGEDITSDVVKKRAMENAALAYRTVMPDFDTMSNLTRQINSVVPFYAASVAGTRSLGKALRRDPAGTAAKAMALGIAPTVGVTAFSLMQPAGQEFYKDMEESGQKRVLDDNMIVVLPGAHKDTESGEWKGIIKVPLAPEFRAINQTTWRAVRGAMGGEGPEASHVALSLFDAVTGGVRSSENPLISTRRILAGEDPRTGERIIKGDMANLPKEEQLYDTTSNAGKIVGGVLGTSPIQGDKILGQFGLAGQTAKNGGDPVEATKDNVSNRFTGGFGESAANSFFKTYSPVKARRDKVSKEVTSLVQQGKLGEARRKAEEFNSSLNGKFSSFDDKFGKDENYDPQWDDLMEGLFIRTSEKAFTSRARQ
jgi:hypothetical protein